MKKDDLVNKRMRIAEGRISELISSGDIKKLDKGLTISVSKFYETKSLSRLETARLIYSASKNASQSSMNRISSDYSDYSESVAAAYYSMYYIVHAYLAKIYSIKLSDEIRGVHALTQHLILVYLVKTGKLAKHLYEEYLNTFETTAEVQNLDITDFQKEAYHYAEKYDEARDAREIFTYKVALSAEARHAESAIKTAEEFISVIRQLMIK